MSNIPDTQPPIAPDDVPAYHRLGAEPFQGLARELFRREVGVKRAENYGINGNAQHGVDLRVFRTNGTLHVVQCKNYQKFTGHDLKKACKEFLRYWDSRWKLKSVTTFILFIGCRAEDTKFLEERDTQSQIFASLGVELEVWTAREITDRVKTHPDLAHQYFPHWLRFWGLPQPASEGQDRFSGPEIESLLRSFSGAVLEQVDRAAAAFQSGKYAEASETLERVREAHLWSTIGPEVQARVYRLYAYLSARDQLGAAWTYAEQAEQLCPVTADLRLKAYLYWKAGELQTALQLLADSRDHDDRRFCAGMLLGAGQVQDAWEILKEPHADDAEWLRLGALVLLFRGDLVEARRLAEASVATAPTNSAAREALGIIITYLAVSPVGWPRSSQEWLSPSLPSQIRFEPDSLESLKEAESIFKDLCLRATEPEDRRSATLWYMATILSQPGRKDEAALLFSDEVRKDPTNSFLLHWIAANTLDIDYPHLIDELEGRRQTGGLSPECVLALAHLYLSLARPEAAIALLKEEKARFEQEDQHIRWLCWLARALSAAAKDAEAIDLLQPFADRPEVKPVLQGLMYDARRLDPSTLASDLLQRYEASERSEFLLQACEVQFSEGRYDWIAERATELWDRTRTARAVWLGSTSLFRTSRLQELLDFVEKIEEPGLSVERLRVLGLLRLQRYTEADEKSAQLLVQFNDYASMELRAEVLHQINAREELARLARKLESHPETTTLMRLTMAQVLSELDLELSQRLWIQANKAGVGDDEVELAISVAFRSALDTHPLLGQLFLRLKRKTVSIDELLKSSEDWLRRAKQIEEDYRSGAPVHLFRQALKLPLVELYREMLLKNESRLDPLRNPTLFVRSGRRALVMAKPANASRLNVDLTAFLLANHLGIWAKVKEAYPGIRFSRSFAASLATLYEELIDPQPSIATAQRDILQSIEENRVTVVEDPSADDFVELDFNSKRGKSNVVGVGPVLRYLARICPEEAERLTQVAAGLSKTKGRPKRIRPQEKMLVDAHVMTSLQQAGVLELLTQHFVIHLTSNDVEQLRQRQKTIQERDASRKWLRRLQTEVISGLETGQFSIIPEDRSSEWHVPSEVVNLAETLSFPDATPGDVIWTDDRFSTDYLKSINKAPIVGALEILTWLREDHFLSESEFYGLLIRMRASNLRYIPYISAEILYHLRMAKVDNSSHELVESRPLRILRKSLNAALYHASNLKPPQGVEDVAEWEYLARVVRECGDALVGIFDSTEESKVVYPRANWLLLNIFVEAVGARECAGGARLEDSELRQAGSFAALLWAGMAYRATNVLDTLKVHEDYLQWLDLALFRNRPHHPDFLPIVADAVKNFFREAFSVPQVPEKALQAQKAFLNHYFHHLPDAVRATLQEDWEFCASIGADNSSAMAFDSLTFDTEDFIAALRHVVERGRADLKTLGEKDAVFVEAGSKFFITCGGKRVEIARDLANLFHPDPHVAKRALEDLPDWFDLPDTKPAIELVLKSKDVSTRIAAAYRWRDESPAFRYALLSQQLQKKKPENEKHLLQPSKAARLLPRYGMASPLPEDFQGALADATGVLGSFSIGRVFERLSCFPSPLPESFLLRWVKEFRSGLRDPGSPLARVHLAYLAVNSHDIKLIDYGWQLCKHLLSEAGAAEIDALLSICRWSEQYFSDRNPEALTETTILALSWAHAEELMRLFQARSIDPRSVKSNFRGMLEPFSEIRTRIQNGPRSLLDVANPQYLEVQRFQAWALHYVLSAGANPPAELLERLEHTLFPFQSDFPDPHLLGAAWAPNRLGSFLAHHPCQKESVVSKSLSGEAFLSFASTAFDKLAPGPDAPTAVAILATLCKGSTDIKPFKKRLDQYLKTVDLRAHIDSPAILNAMTELLRLAGRPAGRRCLYQLISLLPTVQGPPERLMSYHDIMTRWMLAVACGEKSTRARVIELSALLDKGIRQSSGLAQYQKAFLLKMCIGLTHDLAPELWKQLIHARAAAE